MQSVQASQGCFHHLQARLVWALQGGGEGQDLRPGQGVAMPEGDDTAGGSIASPMGIQKGFIRKAELSRALRVRSTDTWEGKRGTAQGTVYRGT